MSPKRLIPPLILIAAAAAGGAWWWHAHPAPQDGPLVVNGNVDIRQVDLAFKVEGQIATMAVQEGDRVAPGDVLATLDTGYFLDTLDLAKARLAAQEATVAKLEAGNRPQEIARARADLAEADAELANTRKTFDRLQELVKTSAASRQAVDDARGALDQAQARRKAKAESLDLALAGTRPEDIAAARATLKADQATVALAERRLADATLTAPAAGTILTRIKEPGTVVGSGTPVLALSVTDPVWVRAYVSGLDLGRIHPGQAATVITDSHPDRPYHGQVGFISPTAEFTPKTVETKDLRTGLVYRFRVVIADADEGLRQGMPVTVELDEAGAKTH
ncbi:MAG: secretion protein HlyD [Rhodobacterales bacterium]|nr:secretion protein HlyD [Rhodobacterales bacterium]